MTNTLRIRNASILTMDAEVGELTGDVLVEDGSITALGTGITQGADEVVDAEGGILMPGMVDTHRHVWETIDLGGISQYRRGDFMPQYQQWKMRTMASMAPDDHFLAEHLGGLMAISSGVTSLLDFAHGATEPAQWHAAANGFAAAGIRGFFAYQLGVAAAYKPGDSIALDVADRQRVSDARADEWHTLEALKQSLSAPSSLVRLCVAPSRGNGKPMREVAEEWGRIRAFGSPLIPLHLHKPAQPHPVGHMGHRGSGIVDLAEAQLLGSDFHAVHGNALTLEELQILHSHGSKLSVTPLGETPYLLHPARGPSAHGRAVSMGVATGLGQDVPAALSTDFFDHIRAAHWTLFADTGYPALAKDSDAFAALSLGTAGGAAALGLQGQVGMLRVGMRADMVLLKTSRLGFGRGGSLVERVVGHACAADVDAVWIDGVCRKRHGRLLGVDEDVLLCQLASAQDRVWARAASISFITGG